jgi:hypothetical protein
LPLHALCCGEDTSHFTGAIVADLLFRLELASVGSHRRNTLGLPSAAQILLLTLPVFHKYDTPQAVDNGVDNGITTQEKPA